MKSSVPYICPDCGVRCSSFLSCRKCKEAWRKKAFDLASKGFSPISIAVKVDKPWRDVVVMLHRSGFDVGPYLDAVTISQTDQDS